MDYEESLQLFTGGNNFLSDLGYRVWSEIGIDKAFSEVQTSIADQSPRVQDFFNMTPHPWEYIQCSWLCYVFNSVIGIMYLLHLV